MSGGNPRDNIKRLLKVADEMGASYRVKKSLVAAALVESGGRHIRYGDRDSVGILQQRPSMGWGSPNDSIEKDARDYLKKAIALDKRFKGTSGQLAQAVQRSAFPDRYDQRGKEAERYLKMGASPRGSIPGGTVTATETVPGVDFSKQRALAKLQYLNDPATRNSSTGLFNLKTQLDTLKDVPAETVSKTRGFSGGVDYGSSGGGSPRNIREMADLAKRMGLRVGEDGRYDPNVEHVHAPGSYHYQSFDGGKTRAGMDISGDPAKMAKYARLVAKRYGSSVAELFWNGPGSVNIKNGKRVGRGFVSGHTDHVHVAVKPRGRS